MSRHQRPTALVSGFWQKKNGSEANPPYTLCPQNVPRSPPLGTLSPKHILVNCLSLGLGSLLGLGLSRRDLGENDQKSGSEGHSSLPYSCRLF